MSRSRREILTVLLSAPKRFGLLLLKVGIEGGTYTAVAILAGLGIEAVGLATLVPPLFRGVAGSLLPSGVVFVLLVTLGGGCWSIPGEWIEAPAE